MSSICQTILDHPWSNSRENHYYRWYPKSLSKAGNKLPFFDSEIEGLYIHVPFCDKICSFCPYVKGLSNEDEIELYTKALIQEIEFYSNFVESKGISFIYFGGGTPSVLNQKQISTILEKLNKIWGINEHTEISLETHPTHAYLERLRNFKNVGVNRVSIGIQSFDKNNLKKLGAAHDAIDCKLAVESASQVFDNFAIDLIYSYAEQSTLSWEKDIDFSLISARVPHISCYPIVPTSSRITTKSLADEIFLALYAIERGKEMGMERYASCSSGGFDMALPGKASIYEKSHWGAPQARFLGLGPSAFGFLGQYTTVNNPRTKHYLSRLLDSRELPLVSFHEISDFEKKHRYFSLGVKTYYIPFQPYIDHFKESPFELFAEHFETLVSNGLAKVTADDLALTEIGKLYIDNCSSLFFSEAERSVPHPEEFEISSLQKMV